MALSVADKLEILDLAARYNHALDVWDADRWVDCFTEDGVMHAGPDFSAAGREQLLEFIHGLEERGWPAQHWTNSPLIEGDGDQATMRMYLLVVNIGADEGAGIAIGPLGTYDDDLVRIDGEWKFRRRVLS